jgi:hypothetical protein
MKIICPYVRHTFVHQATAVPSVTIHRTEHAVRLLAERHKSTHQGHPDLLDVCWITNTVFSAEGEGSVQLAFAII